MRVEIPGAALLAWDSVLTVVQCHVEIDALTDVIEELARHATHGLGKVRRNQPATNSSSIASGARFVTFCEFQRTSSAVPRFLTSNAPRTKSVTERIDLL